MRENIHQPYKHGATAVLEAPDTVPVYQQVHSTREEPLLEALRRGDEDAYIALLQRYYASMLRRALHHVSNPEVAEEVVQEAWMGIFQGLQGFEGRCTLRTWIFSILVHCAQKRGVREKRCAPFSSLFSTLGEAEEDETATDSAVSDLHERSPALFQKVLFCQERFMEPEEYLLMKELRMNIEGALGLLPLRLRKIVTLRILEEQSAEEVYRKYHISKTNQRVLLHRARIRIRALLERNHMHEQPV